jgi:hypothetical protein
MLLLLHICIALFSVGYSTFLFAAPTRRRLHTMYGLIVATLTTGTFLVAFTKAPLLASCTSGLLYIGFVSVGVTAAHRKLAEQKIRR